MPVAMFTVGIFALTLWILALIFHNEEKISSIISYIAMGASIVVSILVIINFGILV